MPRRRRWWCRPTPTTLGAGLMTQAIRDDNPVVFLYHYKGIMGLPWMSY